MSFQIVYTNRLRALAPLGVMLTLAGCATEEVPLEVVRDGHVYDLVDPGTRIEPAPGVGAAASVTSSDGLEDSGDAAQPLHEWSREALADALRVAFMHRNGGVYVAREPHWQAADAILDGDDHERHVDVQPGSRKDDLDPISWILAEAGRVIGSDGRLLMLDTRIHPHDSIARIELYTGTTFRKECTGAYIGPWTFVTSAHCLVYSDLDRINRIKFQPGRVGASMPFGNFDCRLDDASTTNDFYWSVPAGYMFGQQESLDYAVIDTYPCHGAPRHFAGYAVNRNNETYTAFGYPSGVCPGAPGVKTYQCGMSGPAYVNEWRIETEHIDQTAGQDGAPWYLMLGSQQRVAGVAVGYREYHDFGRCGFDVCRRNFARRFDDSVDLFIKAVSYDF